MRNFPSTFHFKDYYSFKSYSYSIFNAITLLPASHESTDFCDQVQNKKENEIFIIVENEIIKP
jgi:hypothetical protein